MSNNCPTEENLLEEISIKCAGDKIKKINKKNKSFLAYKRGSIKNDAVDIYSIFRCMILNK